jgi:hypothetical protein
MGSRHDPNGGITGELAMRVISGIALIACLGLVHTVPVEAAMTLEQARAQCKARYSGTGAGFKARERAGGNPQELIRQCIKENMGK